LHVFNQKTKMTYQFTTVERHFGGILPFWSADEQKEYTDKIKATKYVSELGSMFKKLEGNV